MVQTTLCPEEELGDLTAFAGSATGDALESVDRALTSYPQDPRLHFLRGSLLASAKDYAAAREAIRQAVEIAPRYDIARFQLGLLSLTSGDVEGALQTWHPLKALSWSDPLHQFALGLEYLAVDNFDQAVRCLERGITANLKNEPLNRDMRMVIEQILAKSPASSDVRAISSAQFLLSQSSKRQTRH